MKKQYSVFRMTEHLKNVHKDNSLAFFMALFEKKRDAEKFISQMIESNKYHSSDIYIVCEAYIKPD